MIWIFTVVSRFHRVELLAAAYPISWVLTAAVHLACLLVVRHKMKNKLKLSID